FRDVAGDHDIPAHGRVVTEVGDAVFEPAPRAVLVHRARCRRRRVGTRRLGVGEGGPQASKVVGVDAFAAQTFALLRADPPQQPFERRARVLELALGTHHDDEVADVLHQRSEAAFAGFHLFAGKHSLGDVVGQTLDGDEIAGLVVHRHAPVLEVHVLTVGPPPADDNRLARVELHGRLRAVVGVDELVPDPGLL